MEKSNEKEYLVKLLKEFEALSEHMAGNVAIENIRAKLKDMADKFGEDKADSLISTLSEDKNIFHNDESLRDHLEAHVNNYIKYALIGKNSKDVSFKDCKSLARTLLEAKVQIDRWDQVSNVFLFNPSKKDFIIKNLDDKVYFNKGSYHIWGASIQFLSDMPENKGMVLSLLKDGRFSAEMLGFEVEAYFSVCMFDISES